jgi:hypothetical protein
MPAVGSGFLKLLFLTGNSFRLISSILEPIFPTQRYIARLDRKTEKNARRFDNNVMDRDEIVESSSPRWANNFSC